MIQSTTKISLKYIRIFSISKWFKDLGHMQLRQMVWQEHLQPKKMKSKRLLVNLSQNPWILASKRFKEN